MRLKKKFKTKANQPSLNEISLSCKNCIILIFYKIAKNNND